MLREWAGNRCEEMRGAFPAHLARHSWKDLAEALSARLTEAP